MNIVVCMFGGLLLVVSGTDLGVLLGNGYISLVCNVLGCGMLGYGSYLFFQKKKKETQEQQKVWEAFGKEQKECMERIHHMQQKQAETLQQIVTAVTEVQSLPEYGKKHMENMEEIADDLIKQMKYLAEDMEEQGENHRKEFSKLLDSLEENTETTQKQLQQLGDSEADMVQQLQQLGAQYTQFEKTVNSLVEKMTWMTKQDIEAMKGFFHE